MNNFSKLKILLEEKRQTTKQSLTKAIYGAAEQEGKRRLSKKKKPSEGKAIRKAEGPKKEQPKRSVTKGQSQSRVSKLKRKVLSFISPKAAWKEGRRKGMQDVARREAPGDTHHRVTMQKYAARQTASRAGTPYKELPHGGGDPDKELSFIRPKVIPRSKRH